MIELICMPSDLAMFVNIAELIGQVRCVEVDAVSAAQEC